MLPEDPSPCSKSGPGNLSSCFCSAGCRWGLSEHAEMNETNNPTVRREGGREKKWGGSRRCKHWSKRRRFYFYYTIVLCVFGVWESGMKMWVVHYLQAQKRIMGSSWYTFHSPPHTQRSEYIYPWEPSWTENICSDLTRRFHRCTR